MGLFIERGNFSGWLASFLIIGTLYGGGFGVIPALCSDLFGSHISAATHGIMIGVWASAAVVGIPIFSSITAKYSNLNAVGVRVPFPEAYIINSRWLCSLPAIAFFVCLFLNISTSAVASRRKAGGLRLALGRKRAICITRGGLQWLGPSDIEREEREEAERGQEVQAKVEKKVVV